MSPDDSKADLVLDAVKLVRTQLEIRDRRRADEPEERVRGAATALGALRRAWWSRVQQADRQTGGHPLAQLAQRVGLEPEEVDILIVALVAQLEPDLRDAIARAGRPFIGVDAIVDLVGHDARTRFEARRRLTPIAPLARHGLLALHPRAADPGGDDLEVRPTEALLTFLLGRPLEAGPLARFGRLSAPRCDWSQVVLPDGDARRVRELVAGAPAMRKSLDEWGIGRLAPRARGLVLLVAGPAGTGKATLAHALAHGLGRPILTLHTPRLTAAGPRLGVALAELLGVAATSGAVVLLEDYELLADAHGAPALLEALDHHLGADGIVVLTCNDPARVDPALSRRVHLRLDLAAPDAAARAAIWRVHLPAEVPLAPDVDVGALAADHALVGACIRDAVAHALAMMAARGEPQLSAALLGEAAAAQRPVTPGGRSPG